MISANKVQRLIQPPAGYEPTIATWVWALEDTRHRTKQTLADLSDATLSWLPPEGGNTIGTLLYHLAFVELSYLYEDILAIGWSAELEPLLPYEIRDAQHQLISVLDEPLSVHLQRLDAGRTLLLNTLRPMTLDDFRRTRHLEEYDITPEWTLHHLMQHEAEHRGQIGELRVRAG